MRRHIVDYQIAVVDAVVVTGTGNCFGERTVVVAESMPVEAERLVG